MITTSTARQWQESQRRQQRNSFRFPSGWPHKAYKPAPLVAICMTAHIRVDNNIDNLESHCKSRNSNIPIEVNTTWINMISQFKIINNMLIQHHIIYIYIYMIWFAAARETFRLHRTLQSRTVASTLPVRGTTSTLIRSTLKMTDSSYKCWVLRAGLPEFWTVFLVGCASCLRPQPFHAYDLENKWIGHCSRKHIFFHFKDVYIYNIYIYIYIYI